MTLSANVPFFLLLATSASAFVVSLLLWRRRRIAGGTALVLMMLAVCEWTLAGALEAGADSLALKILFSKLEYVGSGGTALFLLVFALRHAGRDAWLTRLRVAAFAAIPLANLVLVFTNDWHRLLWTGFSEGAPGSHQIIYHHGPVFYAIVAALCVLILPATVVLLRTAARESAAHRRQAAAILVASIAPWIGTVVYIAIPNVHSGLNIIPMSFALTGLILSISIAGLKHFDVIPIARSALIEGMRDGVLVLDARGFIVDANAAVDGFLASPDELIGHVAEEALARWPDIVRLCRSTQAGHNNAQLGTNPPRFVDVQMTPLYRRNGELYARLVVLRDITSRQLAEEEIQRVNTQLQNQLQEVERLHIELRDQAMRDALTHLFNRRYLQETLPREVARSRRDDVPLAILLLDVDRFKTHNDTAGHQAGDSVLQLLGRILRSETRAGDIACRFGGDEFAVILPNTSASSAADRAEGLRKRFSDETLALGYISVSVGVAEFPRDGSDGEQVLRAADRALYKAKAAGRDCVRTAESPAADR